MRHCALNILTIFLSATVATFTLTTCNNTNRQVSSTFTQVVSIVEQNPDSALMLLNAIEQPENLPQKLYMKYELLRVQAKDKAYQDISNDTAIFEVAQYFIQEENINNTILATLYCGRVYHEQKKYEEATKSYLMANDYAEKTTDVAIKGLINHFLGEVNYLTCDMQKAMSYFKIACRYFCMQGKRRNEIYALLAIGNCFLFEEVQDSALFYYSKGLNLAELHQDTSLQSDLHQTIGLTYKQMNDCSSAAAHFQQAAVLGAKKEQQAMLYRNLAFSYYDFGLYDSASFYAHKIFALHAIDSAVEPIELVNAHELLARLEERQGQYQKALKHHRQYIDLLSPVLEKRLSTSVLEVQKKYDVEKMQNLHNRQVIRYQRIGIGLLLLLLGATLAGWFFRNRYQQTQRQLQGKKHEMDSLIQKFQQLEVEEENLLEKLQHAEVKGKMYDAVLQQRLSSLREATLWKWGLNDDSRNYLKEALSKFNMAVYRQTKGSDWEQFYEAVNAAYGGTLKRLSKRLSPLEEDEKKICTLIFANFNEAEMAIVTGLSNRMVRQKKSSIRQKLGIAEYGNIFKALQELDS